MSLLTDRTYLQQHQYKTSNNLNARIEVHRRFSTNPYGFPRWAFEQIPFGPSQRVLEVGGGPGSLWRENLDRLPTDLQACLSDLSIGMVKEARVAINAAYPFAVLDAQMLPFSAAGFDLVIANHMLYHLPDLARGLREIARVLKPGGTLYAATNGVQHLREVHALIVEFDPAYTGRTDLQLSFRLENATDHLRPHFAQIEVRVYEDSLWVTEATPLVNYILSLWDMPPLLAPELEKFLRPKIERAGGIRITKTTGMVVGQK